MNISKINIAARTDKAGRPANQDSLWVCADLEHVMSPNPESVNKDIWIPLGSRGALLVVADGMGGASSGEIASATVIDNLRTSFHSLPEQIPGDRAMMQQFMMQALSQADSKIKEYANLHPESKGMGSTTVMVWVYADTAICAWVGDSRIYRFGRNGLERLSHDHSYVQELVDAGAITQEQAFDHPNGNIITRAMGDTGKPVQPDVKSVQLNPGDMLLLCSDGLSGLLPDSKIQSVIEANIKSRNPSEVLKALWTEGEAAGWTDNATVVVAMTAGPAQVETPPVAPAIPSTSQPAVGMGTNSSSLQPKKASGNFPLPKWVLWLICLLVGILAALMLVNYLTDDSGTELVPQKEQTQTPSSSDVKGAVEDLQVSHGKKNRQEPANPPKERTKKPNDSKQADKAPAQPTQEEQADKFKDALLKEKPTSEPKPQSPSDTKPVPENWKKK